jgi:hypothetical protein
VIQLFFYLVPAAAGVAMPVPDLWTWIATTTTAEGVLNTIGAAGIAILFATDRIMTKGGHERRTKDLIDFHMRELATIENAQRDRIAGLVQSNTEYKTALAAERERADLATNTVREFADAIELIPSLLSSLTAGKGGTS